MPDLPKLPDVEACPFCDYDGPNPILHDFGDAILVEPLDPVVPGHRLVIPKAHVTSFAPSPPTTAAVMAHAAEYVAVQGGDFNLIASKGEAATQTVQHLHVHLVPRQPNDGLALPWSPAIYAAHREAVLGEVREAFNHRIDWLRKCAEEMETEAGQETPHSIGHRLVADQLEVSLLAALSPDTEQPDEQCGCEHCTTDAVLRASHSDTEEAK